MTVVMVLKQELRIFRPQEPEQQTFSDGPLSVYVRLKASKMCFPVGLNKNGGFLCEKHIQIMNPM